MIETFILYVLMALLGPLVVGLITKNRTVKSTSVWLQLLIPLGILSFVIGGRYEVGTDWPEYFAYYQYYKEGSITSFSDILKFGENLEPLYILLMKICGFLGFSSSLFFMTIGLGIFILILGSHRDRAFLFPLLLFFFFGQMFGTSMNIIRQCIAISFFFYSLQYIGTNRLMMGLFIAIGVLFHYSSIVLVVALIIDYKWFDFLNNKNLVLITFILTSILGVYLLPVLVNIIPVQYLSDKYVGNFNNIDDKMSVSSGMGILSRKIVDVILILYSTKVVNFFNDNRIKYVYRLYFIGIILSNVVGVSVYLSRLFLGLELLRIFILAYFCYYSSRSGFLKDNLIKCGIYLWIIVGIFMGVLHGDAGCSPYNFLWQ